MEFLIFVVVIFGIEAILRRTWNPAYFRYGILVFKKKYATPTPEFRFPSVKELDRAFDEGAAAPSLVFHEFTESMVGIKDTPERFMGRYPAILHATLQHGNEGLTLRCFFSLTLTVLLIGGSVLLLPDYFLSIGTYGNILIHLAFLTAIGGLIVSALVVMSVYAVARFKKAVLYCLKAQERGPHNPALHWIADKAGSQ